MLKISKLADYATVLMSHLAQHPGQFANATEMAKATGIATPTVSKLLKILTKAQLLNSQQGKRGGYRLARSAQDISLAQIIAIFDGEIALTACSQAAGHCQISLHCHIAKNWQLINQKVEQALASIKLTDMLADSSIAPPQSLTPLKQEVN